jgi:hypothetical protein
MTGSPAMSKGGWLLALPETGAVDRVQSTDSSQLFRAITASGRKARSVLRAATRTPGDLSAADGGNADEEHLSEEN